MKKLKSKSKTKQFRSTSVLKTYKDLYKQGLKMCAQLNKLLSSLDNEINKLKK